MALKPSTAIDEQRQQLVRFIEEERPQGSSSNDVTLVFDGRVGMGGPPRMSGTKAIFSQDRSADEIIKDIVNKARNKKNIIVVTDDRDVRYAVKAEGAQVLSVKDFLNKPGRGVRKSSELKASAKSNESKNISKVLESQITSEMAEIWVKKKKN